MVPSKPRVCAYVHAQAMVFTLFGASGHSPRTGPSYRISFCFGLPLSTGGSFSAALLHEGV